MTHLRRSKRCRAGAPVIVRACAAFAQNAGNRGAQPHQAALDRPQVPVACSSTGDGHHPVRPGRQRRRRRWSGRRGHGRCPGEPPPARRGPNGDGVLAASGSQVGGAAERERQVERVRVVNRVEAAPGQRRPGKPSVVKTGWYRRNCRGHVMIAVAHSRSGSGSAAGARLGPGQRGRVRRRGDPSDGLVVGRGEPVMPGTSRRRPAACRRARRAAYRSPASWGSSEQGYVPEKTLGEPNEAGVHRFLPRNRSRACRLRRRR